jgi:glycosyltransferase involved in cell wall biosynthesis
MKIFIWIRALDYLKLHTWNAVQSKLEQKITYVVTDLENLGRKRQGWPTDDLSDLDIIPMRIKGWWQPSTKILRENPDALHVFWGFWSDRRLFFLIMYALAHGRKTAVLSEHYSTSPVGYMVEENPFVANLKVFLRPLLYRFAAALLGYLSKNTQLCIFPLSLQSLDQCFESGFPQNTLFPFGCFVPRINISQHAAKSKHLRLIFVGALLKRKGLDIACKALQKINRDGVKAILDVYGSGDPALFISKVSDSVSYKGVIEAGKAQTVIAQYDALLLPSRHDGWGVVVNEALLQGIPVIASDQVGAKCLVEASGAGIVFKNEDVNDLAAQLNQLIETPELVEGYKAKPKMSQIHPTEAAAQHFWTHFPFIFITWFSSTCHLVQNEAL